MWILVSESNPNRRHELLCGKSYTIGRKDCDILIEDDMSISRKHAMVSVSHPETQVVRANSLPVLTFEDKSRLGSLVGDTRITQNKCVLSHGTLLVFGSAGVSKHRAIYEPYITTTSCLDAAGKKQTRQLIGQLGGHVISEWKSECSVLIMNTLSITIKAICALIAQKPIVTPQYLVALVSSMENGNDKPDPDRFLPPLAESQLDPTLVSFSADSRRQKVFQGQLFFFLTSKQFKKLSVAIEQGGGTPMLLEQKSDDNADLIQSPGSCVMSCDLNDQSQNLSKSAQEWITEVNNILNKQKKRAIQECEIGYAVLYCTTEKYCNPNTEAGPPAAPVPGQTLSQMDLSISQLQAPETQQRGSAVAGTSQNPASQLKTKVTVKTEPLSQPPEPGSERRVRGEKRARESDGDTMGTPAKLAAVKRELVSPPGADRNNQRTIKMEKVTPAKPSAAKRSPSPVPQNEGRRNIRRSSPSPDDMRRSTRRRSASPAPDNLFGKRRREKSPSPASSSPGRGRRRKNSPSPGPSSPSGPSVRQIVKPEKKQEMSQRRRWIQPSDEEEDNGPSEANGNDELFTFSSRKSRKAPNRKRDEEPEPAAEENDDDDDLFSFGSRRSRKPKELKTENVSKGPELNAEDSDGEDDLFSFGSRKSQKVRGTKRADPAGDALDTVKETEEPVTQPRRSSRRSPSPYRRDTERQPKNLAKNIKSEAKQEEDEEEDLFSGNDEETNRDVKPSTSRNNNNKEISSPPVQGFLSTRQPVKDQANVDKDFVFDTNLPSNLVQVTEASLVVRKPGQAKVKDTSNKWQGKVVRNFKKFRKVAHAGSMDLPTVIGGNDLVAHDRTHNKELEEWFMECLERESQTKASQREADELFAFSKNAPAASKTKSKSTRGRRR